MKRKGYLMYFWASECDSYRTKNFLQAFREEKDFSTVASCNCKLWNSITFFLKSDIVYIAPYEHSCFKIIVCRLFNKKIICDIYAPKYDTAVNDMQLYSRNTVKGRIQYLRDWLAMKKSTKVLFLTKAEACYYVETVGLNTDQVNYEVIPLCIDDKGCCGEIPYFNDKREDMHIYWTGSFINLQGVDRIIEAFSILKEDGFKFKAYIIGPNKAEKSNFKKIVEEKRLTNNVFFPDIWGNMDYWQSVIKTDADISLGIFGNSTKAKTVLANKVVDGVSFGTPVVTGYSKGAEEFFYNNAIYFCSNTPECIANKIIEISKIPKETINKNIYSAYTIYRKQFTYSALKQRVNKLLKEVIFDYEKE